MKSSIWILIWLLPVVACTGQAQNPVAAPADRSEPDLIRQSYTSPSEGDREYFVYLPRGYNSDTQKLWPVMLFLHGDGERGNAREDLDWVLVHGPLYEAWIQKRELPFVIVVPQLPLYGRKKNCRLHRQSKTGGDPPTTRDRCAGAA
jgi:predicted peptidase